MLLEEKTIKTKRIYEGKMINLRVDEVELPENQYSTREIVEHPGAVAIIPITDNGEIVMVKQFRKPVETFLIEIPAGKLDKREKPLSCAVRELKEETGYIARNTKLLFSYYSSPGFSDELIYIYIATGLVKGNAKPDEGEHLCVKHYNVDKIMEMIQAGDIKDSKTLIGIMGLKMFYPTIYKTAKLND